MRRNRCLSSFLIRLLTLNYLIDGCFVRLFDKENRRIDRCEENRCSQRKNAFRLELENWNCQIDSLDLAFENERFYFDFIKNHRWKMSDVFKRKTSKDFHRTLTIYFDRIENDFDLLNEKHFDQIGFQIDFYQIYFLRIENSQFDQFAFSSSKKSIWKSFRIRLSRHFTDRIFSLFFHIFVFVLVFVRRFSLIFLIKIVKEEFYLPKIFILKSSKMNRSQRRRPRHSFVSIS